MVDLIAVVQAACACMIGGVRYSTLAGRMRTAWTRKPHLPFGSYNCYIVDTAAVKAKLQREWAPEYQPQETRPPQETPDVHSERATNVTLNLILKDQVGRG